MFHASGLSAGNFWLEIKLLLSLLVSLNRPQAPCAQLTHGALVTPHGVAVVLVHHVQGGDGPFKRVLHLYGDPGLLQLDVQLVHHHTEEYQEDSHQDRS